MAVLCIDLFRVLFYSLPITFASCHSRLPRDATTLAARDGSQHSHNWHKVMQILKSTDSRIGIPQAALPNLQLDVPLILEMAPYDLKIVPNGAFGSPENELIEADEHQLMVFTEKRGAKSIQRCERPGRGLQSVLAYMQAQEVEEAVPKRADLKGLLYAHGMRTPIWRPRSKSQRLAIASDQFWFEALLYPWVLPGDAKPPKQASPT